MTTTYHSIKVTRDGAIGTIGIDAHVESKGSSATSSHSEVGRCLDEFRFDNSIRVVVITGSGGPNGKFFVPPPGRPRMAGRVPGQDWDAAQGLQRTFQTIIEMEKPVIAKVNGNAAGSGASLIFACDFIIAREDAALGDSHIGMGEGEHFPLGRSDSGTAPGDGGTVFAPLHMSPPIAREYLWLAKQFTGAELARMGAINRAVPAADLDAAVQQMAEALLRRPAYALALSKRAFNRFIAERFNLTFSLAHAYERLNFYQYGRYVDGRGEDKL